MTFPRDYAEQAGAFLDAVANAVERNINIKSESPIESIFLTTFKMVSGTLGTPVNLVVDGKSLLPDLEDLRKYFIEPQFNLGDYRVDFAIGPWPKDGRLLIVECDGHDFHERTKEQAAKDRSRDRAIQASGYKIFRFTGMELHRRTFECVTEVYGEMIRWAK